MVIPLVALVPCVTVTLDGEAETLKFGWDVAFTVSPDFHALVGHYKLVKHPDLVKPL